MNKLMALTTALLLTASAYAAATPQTQIDDAVNQAKALAAKQDYAAAAAAIDTLSGDLDITAQTSWPDALYLRAHYLARTGQTEAALGLIERAVRDGAAIKSSELAKEAEFESLRDNPRFKAAFAALQVRERLWAESPAIATPYKPELTEAEKVAGLSKLWAEARFNFPFFERVPDLDWDATYMAYLPQVRAAKTTEDYYRVLIRFYGTLMDGHTRVLPPADVNDRFNGVTAVETRLIQGRIIVIGVTDPALEAKGVKVGAEITAIDGKPVLDYANTDVSPYISGFTPQDRAVWQYGFQLLRGPVGTPVHLALKDAKGKTFTADVPRVHNEGPFGILPKLAVEATFKMLPGDIAYLKVNEFQNDAGIKTLKENFAAVSAAKGLIIDIRDNGGGDDRNGLNIVKMLADKPFPGSNWRTRDYKAAQRGWNRPIGWYRAGGGMHQPDPAFHYAGPVAVLTGGRTYSAAEDFTVAIVTSGRGKLIGESTGGSTGNPMLIKLPGGGTAFICTKDDSFADGRVFEGVGIAPDFKVKPTIADIRSGRDPVLEKAVEVLRKTH